MGDGTVTLTLFCVSNLFASLQNRQSESLLQVAMRDAVMAIHCKEKLCFLNRDVKQKTGLSFSKWGGWELESITKKSDFFCKKYIPT